MCIRDSINAEYMGMSDERISHLSQEARSLLCGLLENDPSKRLSAQQALNHPWFEKKFPVEAKIDTRIVQKLQKHQRSNKLYQAIITFISHKVMSATEMEKVVELFKAIDTNHDGKIKAEDFKRFLIEKGYWQDGNDEAFERIRQNMKQDEMGYNDFVTFVISEPNILCFTKLKEAFDQLDEDKDGFLDKEDIQRALIFNGNMKNETWNEMISKYNKNKDGKLSFNDFCDLLMANASVVV
eukprot:TRINITY_DN3629_c0_g1_i1.p1 TRINITY_DN3629_c0_g1~~TRINITY_DN3629_c0_g1_i1.p1  ORF type:complete len:240 (-),score=65.46 TRINITY_DN3629_c0_g1_i1:155-874(-)